MISESVLIPVTCTVPSTGNAWASVAAATGIVYQLVGFSGGGSNHTASVDVLFGSTIKLSHVGASAKSGAAISEFYGADGPITNPSEALIVHTTTQPGGKSCFANLLYRRIVQL